MLRQHFVDSPMLLHLLVNFLYLKEKQWIAHTATAPTEAVSQRESIMIKL